MIGKVHRLGLSGRAKSPSSSAPRARKPRSHMMRVQRPMSRGNTALALAYEMDQEPEPELIENIIPLGQRRTLLELNEDTCRWPIGDPATSEFFFCGGKPLTGLPYCNYHSRAPISRPTSAAAASRHPAGLDDSQHPHLTSEQSGHFFTLQQPRTPILRSNLTLPRAPPLTSTG